MAIRDAARGGDSTDSMRGETAATTEGLPGSPGQGHKPEKMHVPGQASLIDGRALMVITLALVLGVSAGFIAELLKHLIAFVTNVAFYQRLSTQEAMPGDAVARLGWWVLVIPAIGGIV